MSTLLKVVPQVPRKLRDVASRGYCTSSGSCCLYNSLMGAAAGPAAGERHRSLVGVRASPRSASTAERITCMSSARLLIAARISADCCDGLTASARSLLGRLSRLKIWDGLKASARSLQLGRLSRLKELGDVSPGAPADLLPMGDHRTDNRSLAAESAPPKLSLLPLDRRLPAPPSLPAVRLRACLRKLTSAWTP